MCNGLNRMRKMKKFVGVMEGFVKKNVVLTIETFRV